MGQVRKGKTAQDRADGAKERNANNKAMREAWQAAHRQNPRGCTEKFPLHSCNGKKSRALKGVK